MMKKILIGLLIVFLMTPLIAYLMWTKSKSNFGQSIQYKTAERDVRQNRDVLRETNGIIEFKNYGGTLYPDSASIDFTLKGQNKLVIASYKLVRVNEEWKITSVNIGTLKE